MKQGVKILSMLYIPNSVLTPKNRFFLYLDYNHFLDKLEIEWNIFPIVFFIVPIVLSFLTLNRFYRFIVLIVSSCHFRLLSSLIS